MGTITFPHPELTVIEGKPNNTSLQLLQRQLYTNARSVTSPHGGGNNGHLAILMSNAAYIAHAGIDFTVPIHPGAAPLHTAAATAAQIAENIRLFNQVLADHTLYHRVATELKSQILAVVDNTYLRELEDTDFGFADITPLAMLQHLQNTYGTLTPEALENNRASHSDPWNPDNPIEMLWKKFVKIQCIAAAGGAPITDMAAITLTLAMFEKSGLLSTTTQQWRVKPIAQWTWATFKADFSLANTERVRQITAAGAGYHGANSATLVTPGPATPNAAANAATTPSVPTVIVEGGKLYYCWTHGSSPNANHGSGTCLHKANGHIDTATVFNMQGGSITINMTRPVRRRFYKATDKEGSRHQHLTTSY
jgi:hypothetical protein